MGENRFESTQKERRVEEDVKTEKPLWDKYSRIGVPQ
jgi:hypothetical protein